MASRPIQQFVKGQTIIKEGSEGDRSFKILRGEVLICKNNESGQLVPIAKLGNGEIFGEMYLFDAQKTRSATVIAVSSEVMVEVYSQTELLTMFETLSVATQSIFEGLNLRLKKTSRHYVEMIEQAKTITSMPSEPIQENTVITPHNKLKLRKP
ncbi:cyclic nucleotide-binding domain-containing protein [Vampirovibrio sp.]|uniref:cyclic nucleotide-binding domain-containing protein n=1 Tax=Vampirovibrio sp. TaxID=2717857 RepID=UPI00359383B3